MLYYVLLSILWLWWRHHLFTFMWTLSCFPFLHTLLETINCLNKIWSRLKSVQRFSFWKGTHILEKPLLEKLLFSFIQYFPHLCSVLLCWMYICWNVPFCNAPMRVIVLCFCKEIISNKVVRNEKRCHFSFLALKSMKNKFKMICL